MNPEYKYDTFLLYFYLSFAFLQGPLVFIYYTLFGRAYLKIEPSKPTHKTFQNYFHISAGLFYLFCYIALIFWDIGLPRFLGAVSVLVIFLGTLTYLLFALERLLKYLQKKYAWLDRRFGFLKKLGFQHWPVAGMVIIWIVMMNLSSNYLFQNNKHEVTFVKAPEKSMYINKQVKLRALWCTWLSRNNLPTTSPELKKLSHFPDCTDFPAGPWGLRNSSP